MEAQGTGSCGRRPGQPARSFYDRTRKKKASSSSWPPPNRHMYPFHASWPSLGEEIKPPRRCDLGRGTAQVRSPSHLPSPDSTTSRRRRTGVVRRRENDGRAWRFSSPVACDAHRATGGAIELGFRRGSDVLFIAFEY
jgi:hypothetical protein